MELNELTEKGAFVGDAPVAKEIEWTHVDDKTGETVTDKFTVHVHRRSVEWVDEITQIARGTDGLSRTSLIVSQGILFGAKADQRMSYEMAQKLDIVLATLFVRAFNEVNVGDPDPKNSQQKTSSGANSSSVESEDAP